MTVSEIVYSLQGEGARAGEPSIFIRLAGCDLVCSFCDTEFESGEELTVQQILSHIEKFPCHWIVWTGGEPSLQLTEEIVSFFKAAGYSQAIETNGGHRVPSNLDWVTVSPKVAEHILQKNFNGNITELKYVRHAGHLSVPKPKVEAKYYFLSPMFDGLRVNEVNLKHCIDLCLKHPQWRLTIQQHKFWKVP